VEKENVHLICKLEEQLDASHKELHYCNITHHPQRVPLQGEVG